MWLYTNNILLFLNKNLKFVLNKEIVLFVLKMKTF